MVDAPAELPSWIHTPVSWTCRLDWSRLFGATSGRPIEMDLGCGKGRFLAARAAQHPDRNFMGVDRQLGRLQKVERKLRHGGLKNVRLLRIESAYALTQLVPPHSVTALYVFFPDPWPKRRHHVHRVFNPTFLDSVHQALVAGGVIHFATDHADYGESIAKLFTRHPGFSPVPPYTPTADERTDFEVLFLAKGSQISRGAYVAQAPMIKP